ncbi:MAG TPA: DMT family transporter [Clostridiaceae bacterium]|nr:DMT family transporter [Clostridiaceae bacterium]
MSAIKRSNVNMFLLLNAILWGSHYVWNKMLLGYLPRFSILFICSLGGAICTGIAFYKSMRHISRKSLLWGIFINSFSTVSNIFCMLALGATSSSNTAFIVQTSVLITPVLMCVLLKKLPEKKVVAGSLTALPGLFLLTTELKGFHINPGDLFALVNALFFSLFMVATNINSDKIDSKQLTVIHHAMNTVIFFILMACFEKGTSRLNSFLSPIPLALSGISIFIAIATILIQNSALCIVNPERATLIYTLEPVFASIFAFIFIGERLESAAAVAGCILILASVMFSVFTGRKGASEIIFSPVIRIRKSISFISRLFF